VRGALRTRPRHLRAPAPTRIRPLALSRPNPDSSYCLALRSLSQQAFELRAPAARPRVNFAKVRVVYIQGYLAHKKTSPPLGPYSRPILGPYGGPRGGAVFHERGTPVHASPQCGQLLFLTATVAKWIRHGSFCKVREVSLRGEKTRLFESASALRALLTETKVESGTSQSKSGTSVDFR